MITHRLGDRKPLQFLLLLAGDIEMEPGPPTGRGLRFFHWSLGGVRAGDWAGVPLAGVPLVGACGAVHRSGIFAVSEVMLDSTISNDDIFIEGFSKEIYRNDHPGNKKVGGVCLYFREGITIKRRSDLETLQEMIVSEINIAHKKIFFVTLYRSPNQNSIEFENFIAGLQVFVDQVQNEKHHSIILTGDLDCRSVQWWPNDVENPEGTALDEFIETNNLYQLIDTPTNTREGGMSCIDLVITNQPNCFVDSGTHPSLDEHCQHQIIYGKMNISVPYPPPYKRTIWEYSKACPLKIKTILASIDWEHEFRGLSTNKMTDLFTSKLHSILSRCIPNKTIKCHDKDTPWFNFQIKTAI